MSRSTEQTVGFLVAFSLVFLGGLFVLRNHSAVPTSAPIAPASTVLLDQSGNGITTTQRFQAPAEWRIDYRWSACQIPNFSVSIGGDSFDIVSRQGNGGSGTDYEHAGGSEYLSVNSACDWHVVVSG